MKLTHRLAAPPQKSPVGTTKQHKAEKEVSGTAPGGPETQHAISLEKDAYLAGHLATEVVEKIAHGTHHPPAGLSEEIAVTVAHGKGPLGEHGMEFTGSLLQVKGSALAGASHGSSPVAGEVAHHVSTGLATALAGAAAVSGGIGGLMLYQGGKELVHGLEKKNPELVAEGVGGLAVGTRGIASAAVMAGMLGAGSPVLAAVAGVAAQTLTPLGVLHGAIDVSLGVKDIVKGKDRIGGMLKVGFGGAVIAGALVGGVPLALVALGILGAKVTHSVIQSKRAAKQALLEQASSAASSNRADPLPFKKDVQT